MEAGGSPGQHVEAALEVQVASGLGEELRRFLVLMLKDIGEKKRTKKTNQFMRYVKGSS